MGCILDNCNGFSIADASVTDCNSPYRWLDKEKNANEIALIQSWWNELITRIGMRVNYYANGTALSAMDIVYGEQPEAKYQHVGSILMGVELNNDSLLLSKFGIQADGDLTAVVMISSFVDTFGVFGVAEPKGGDLIELAEYGQGRPGGRSAPIFEITERDDENIMMTNPLMGHSVWYIKAKRWEYSFETNVSPEAVNTQLGSGRGGYGVLPGGNTPSEITVPYPDIDTEAQKIFDYSGTDKGDVYGNY